MKFKKYLLWTFSAFLVLGILFFTAVFLRFKSWSSNPEPAQKLAAYFARITKSDFKYKNLEWHLLPFPAARFSEPVFRFKSDLRHELRADSLELSLDLTKIFFGQFGFSNLRLREGVWQGQIQAPKGLHDFSVENIDLKTSALSSDKPVKLYMSGDTGGRRKAVILHGELKLPPLEATDLNGLGFQVQVLTRNFRFQGNPEWELLGWVPSSGVSDFLIVLRRDPMNDRILFSGDAGLRDLIFRENEDVALARTYQAGNLQVKFAGHFSPSTDELKFTQCTATLPFAQFNLQGTYLPHRREFRALTFNFREVKLDDLLKYIPGFKDQVPYFIGFSGLADFSVAVNGLPARLKIYGDLNLTRALFTYGRFFQKPKEKIFRIKTDFDWAEEVLSGEYSGNFEDLNFKGSVTEWKPSGEMKANLITNSFAAEQLAGNIPFLADYEFSGNTKFFADFKGNFRDPQSFERMFHVTMQDGNILRKGVGSGFRDLNFNFDFSPMQAEVKDFRFSLGGSAFDVQLKGFHPEKNPNWEGNVKSEKIIPGLAWKEWTDFWGGSTHAAWLQSQHAWVQRMVLSQEAFESFNMNFSSGGGVFDIPSLTLRAFEGNLAGAFITQTKEQSRITKVQMQGSEMNADAFFKFAGASQLGLQGKMSLEAVLEGVRQENESNTSWSGPFSLSVAQGVLGHFDYVHALEKIEPLKKATVSTTGTPFEFEVLSLGGRVENDRLKADEVKLRSEHLQLDGEGGVDREGIFNFRLNTKVEANYFRELFPKHADEFLSDGDAFFGPITLLAVGSAEELEVKPDPQTISELASYYARRKTESVSRYF